MSISRKVRRAQARAQSAVTSTTTKDRLRRERRLTRGMMNMRATMLGLLHAVGHATTPPKQMDRYHASIAARAV